MLVPCAALVALLGAVLPPHRPLRILIVSDTVNPHGLPSAQLTEATYSVYRSVDAARLTRRCDRIGTTLATSFVDAPPAGSVFFYHVAGP